MGLRFRAILRSLDHSWAYPARSGPSDRPSTPWGVTSILKPNPLEHGGSTGPRVVEAGSPRENDTSVDVLSRIQIPDCQWTSIRPMRFQQSTSERKGFFPCSDECILLLTQ